MRKLVVLSFITLDGVMQAPGGPGEDRTGGFEYGGWVAGYFDDFLGKEMVKQMGNPFDLLLGRKTYEIFAAHWPYVKKNDDPIASGINGARKYVVSKTLIQADWSNSVLIKGDVAKEVQNLKEQDGPAHPIFLGIFVTVIRIPALIVIGFWIFFQFINGVVSAGIVREGGVAWFAHIGGFLAGLLTIKLWLPRRVTRWW